ncbi:SEC10/PgrA surface exclusion domain-containing protein [Streptococcus sp. ZJ93]|uniref:SEC10/PgrA surface exclusion domain-containing protein n=1 Tax=Streptococcus handemini TaxID=3161188 RepID=UPI0034D72860
MRYKDKVVKLLTSASIATLAATATSATVLAEDVTKPADANQPVETQAKPSADKLKADRETKASEVEKATASVTAAETEVATTETAEKDATAALATATDELKAAETAKENATPENIAKTEEALAKNAKEQDKLAEEVAEIDADYKATITAKETATADLEKATAEKDAADKVVAEKETAVADAEKAVNGAEKAELEARVTTLEAEKTDADKALADAEKAHADAKAANENQAKAIQDATAKRDAAKDASDKAATTVTEKAAAVETAESAAKEAKAAVEAAEKAISATSTLPPKGYLSLARFNPEETDIVKYRYDFDDATNQHIIREATPEEIAQGKASIDKFRSKYNYTKESINFVDLYTIYRKNKDDKDLATLVQAAGVVMAAKIDTVIPEEYKNIKWDLANLTDEQIIYLSEILADSVSTIREAFLKMGETQFEGHTKVGVGKTALRIVKAQVEHYKELGKNKDRDRILRHDFDKSIEHLWFYENLGYDPGKVDTTQNLYEIMIRSTRGIRSTLFADRHSNWGHLETYLNGNSVAAAAFVVDSPEFVTDDRPDGIYSNVYMDISTIDDPKNFVTSGSGDETLKANLRAAQEKAAEADKALTAAKAELATATKTADAAKAALDEAESALTASKETGGRLEMAANNLELAKKAADKANASLEAAKATLATYNASEPEKQANLEAAKTALKDAQADADKAAENLKAAHDQVEVHRTHLITIAAQVKGSAETKDRLTKEQDALTKQLDSYKNPDVAIKAAEKTKAEAEVAFKAAQEKADTARKNLTVATATLEKAKGELSAIDAELAKLLATKTSAPTKAGTNVTLPGGEQITIQGSKTNVVTPVVKAPVAAKPVQTAPVVNNVTKGEAKATTATVTKQAGITVTTTAAGQTVSYSRVERAKALPNTGSQESLMMLALGSMMTSLGLAGARRRRRG